MEKKYRYFKMVINHAIVFYEETGRKTQTHSSINHLYAHRLLRLDEVDILQCFFCLKK